jgi:orotate phosphoribosyltransferase
MNEKSPPHDAVSPRQMELRAVIEECGAVLHGHFRLASGRHSDTYIEKFRVLERPNVLEQVCKEIADHFRPQNPDVVAGPSTGGIIVAYEVARQLRVPAVYVETEGGRRILKRGGRIEPEARVLLVDDVLTTGISLHEVISVIQECRANLIGVGVLIDRSGNPTDFGCDFHASSRFEATSYAEDDLPDWLATIPLVTPGTRASTAKT